jgi:hypothetical protein
MAVPLISNLTIGKYLKIVSKGAVYNNLSEDSEIWNMIKQKKAGPAEGRELRFLLRRGYGAAAAGFLPLNGGSYPAGQQSEITEGTTVYKDFAVTVEVERTLIAKAVADLSRYGEPLAEELRAKTIALSRLLSYRAYGDGTGVVGERGTTAETISAGRIVVSLDTASTALGFVGWFQFGDKVVAYTKAGVEETPTVASGTFDHYTVQDRDRENATVTLAARDSSGNELTVTASNISAQSVFYRLQQKTNGNIVDISSISSSTDYNTLSESWVGLESLAANDGRLVNGVTMDGALAGTRRDLGGAAIDSQDFQQLMSRLMINVGQGRYKYSKPLMAWESLDALVESRETDRRFQSIKDDKRGVSQLGYVHGKNTLVFTADEFCPKQRVYMLPEGDVCQFHGGDFEFVNPDGSGQKFFLKPNGSGHDRTIRAYMEGQGALMSVHSSAIGVLENFTV